MSVGPLRRLAGTLGLLALAPTAAMLAAGLITPADAAMRAVVTLLGIMLIARIVGWWLALLAGNLERAGDQAAPDPLSPGRRVSDRPPR
jgi:hypothetical protein